MIKYKLFCKECDLKFDSWFASSNEYERLKKKKLLNCHNCNSVKVEKTIMAPQLISHKSKTDEKLNLEKYDKVVDILSKLESKVDREDEITFMIAYSQYMTGEYELSKSLFIILSTALLIADPPEARDLEP